MRRVGALLRREADRLVVGYSFDLRTNELIPATVPNPSAGVEHAFEAWRVGPALGGPPLLRETAAPFDSVTLRGPWAPLAATAYDED